MKIIQIVFMIDSVLLFDVFTQYCLFRLDGNHLYNLNVCFLFMI